MHCFRFPIIQTIELTVYDVKLSSIDTSLFRGSDLGLRTLKLKLKVPTCIYCLQEANTLVTWQVNGAHIFETSFFCLCFFTSGLSLAVYPHCTNSTQIQLRAHVNIWGGILAESQCPRGLDCFL